MILFRSRHRGRDRRIVPQLVTWIGGILGALALFEVAWAWRPVVMCPGEAGDGLFGMSFGAHLLAGASLLAPALIGLLAVLIPSHLAARLRRFAMGSIALVAIASASWAWFVVLFAVMGECFV